MNSDMLKFKYDNGIAEWKNGRLSQAESTECSTKAKELGAL